jgi:DHA1 family inner membrane transport protein
MLAGGGRDWGRGMPLLPLLTLTLGVFAIGTTEFVIQGLLPEVAADLGVTIPDAGLLVSGYALGVSIGGPIVAIATNNLRRKTTLLLLLGVFVIGQTLCALAPNYAIMMIARVIASLCHGAFMGVGSVVAVGVVREDRRASAVALMWAGGAAANILGVPAGTALGHAFGWRATFWAIAALGTAAIAAVAIFLPDAGRGAQTRFAAEFRVLARPPVLQAIGLGVFACAAMFSVFTYIAPLLLEVTAISPGALPFYLLVFGLGGVIGMQVGGRFGDRAIMASLIGAAAACVLVYLVLLAALQSPTAALVMMFVWGFIFYFPAGAIVLRVVDAAREAPVLASTMIQSGFNLGNALGPFIGGAALSAGLSYALLPLCGAALALACLAIALWSAAHDRRGTLAEA